MKRLTWLTRTGALLTAAALGFGVAAALGVFSARPATAQFSGGPILGSPLLSGSSFAGVTPSAGVAGAGRLPQPIVVEAINDRQFVVATREARVVRRLGDRAGGSYMVVMVVTHYTIDADGLLPIEDVRIPAGYEEVTVAAGR